MFEDLEIEGLKLVTPRKFGDERGFFCETHNAATWAKAGLHYEFVQDNHSLSRDAGTVRGLHYQTAPFAQDKLVRVARAASSTSPSICAAPRRPSGAMWRWSCRAENWRQLFIPAGFAHGFMTLEPDTEVLYKVTNFYSPRHDFGLAWDDPDLGVDWPVGPEHAMLSARDRQWPRLRDLAEVFP